MSECSYDYEDDFYNSIHCDLPEGHKGPHRAGYEWETRPADICRELGHEWGDWKPIPPRRDDITDLLRWRAPIKEPTEVRICTRCQRSQDNGEYEPGWNYFFPVVTPPTNKIPRTA